MRVWVSCVAWLALCACAVAGLALANDKPANEHQSGSAAPYLAMGIKIGEVTPNSAIIWSRCTADAERKNDGERSVGRPGPRTPEYTDNIDVNQLEGSVPGTVGQLRVSWATTEDWSDAQHSDWHQVGEATDFAHQFELTELQPATKYFVRIEARAVNGADNRATRTYEGSFTTAPKEDTWQDVRFGVITCQMYKDMDHADGFHIYPAMAELDLDFFVPAGDNVYYDNEKPRARTLALARYHWHRMFSLPRMVEFFRHHPAYWEKDDHDTRANDAWPSQRAEWMSPLTWEQGLATFREQVPMGENTFRTFRWGQGLQVWLIEGRDFRTPNNMDDGPDKTILGKEQLAWLQKSVEESDAAFRVLVSPTPIVGPDRKGKNDNHANAGFKFEGDLLRNWAGGLKNFYVCCGDRHWQYMSVDPATGVREFSCGAASNEHAGGSPGRDPEYQPFHRVKGGFLSVAITRDQQTPQITFRFHDVHGEVVYEFNDAAK